MATIGPWALTVRAGELDVSARSQLATELSELVEFHRHWALLATCHRVELYGFGPSPTHIEMTMLEGEEAVRHLFRVAAGLESAVVGETEVLGQVRDALATVRAGETDERVARLFECAIAVGRAARTRPLAGGAGLAERAVDWLAARTELQGRPVLVVGTGQMGGALAAAASAMGGLVTVASRRPAHAAMDLAAAAEAVPSMAAVAVALRGEWLQLSARAVEGLPPVADLSAPPAVPTAIQQALGPNFLGIDDLWQRSSADSSWVGGAEAAVAEGAADYMGWLSGRSSVPLLVALRERGESRRQARVNRLLRRLPELDDRGRELVVAMSRQLMTDLLHEPVSALRSDADGSHAEAARRLFNL